MKLSVLSSLLHPGREQNYLLIILINQFDIKSICWEKQAFNESLLVSLKCISDMILRRSQLFINHFNKFAMISILNSE
uniref:Uncharacterized protein n=1 Tax=Piliocolobus tephrosceles TaxID=591936 RepID=A0A8C9GQY0_9PRIM